MFHWNACNNPEFQISYFISISHIAGCVGHVFLSGYSRHLFPPELHTITPVYRLDSSGNLPFRTPKHYCERTLVLHRSYSFSSDNADIRSPRRSVFCFFVIIIPANFFFLTPCSNTDHGISPRDPAHGGHTTGSRRRKVAWGKRRQHQQKVNRHCPQITIYITYYKSIKIFFFNVLYTIWFFLYCSRVNHIKLFFDAIKLKKKTYHFRTLYFYVIMILSLCGR